MIALGSNTNIMIYLGSTLVCGQATPTANPVIYDFEVLDANPNRVYFKSNKAITATTVTGFVIDQHTISSVTINTGLTSGHYFTLSANLSYADSVLIRYEGGSDMADLSSNALYSFNVEYIDNKLSFPAPTRTRYAAPTTQGAGTGVDEANAWSYATAASSAVAGDKVFMLAGSTSTSISISNSGTASNPIHFVGYNNSALDVEVEHSKNLTFSSSVMPLFNNSGIDLQNKDYIILENIQADESDSTSTLFNLDNSQYCYLKNCYGRGGKFIYWQWGYATGQGNTTLDRCYAENAATANMRLRNAGNRVKDSFTSSYLTPGTDYLLSFHGGQEGVNNVAWENTIDRSETDSHTGHGISFKGDDPGITVKLEYSLMQGNTVKKTRGSLEFRHTETQNCVARNNVVDGTGDIDNTIGIKFRDGCSSNLAENNLIMNADYGIRFHNAGESGPEAGFSNTVRNNVFKDLEAGWILADSGTSANSNKFYHNTVMNANAVTNILITFTGNLFKNNIITDSSSIDTEGTWDYNCFYNNTFGSIGTNVVTDNPQLTSSGRTTTSSPTSVTEGGVTLGMKYDIDGVERSEPYSMGVNEI